VERLTLLARLMAALNTGERPKRERMCVRAHTHTCYMRPEEEPLITDSCLSFLPPTFCALRVFFLSLSFTSSSSSWRAILDSILLSPSILLLLLLLLDITHIEKHRKNLLAF